MTWYQRLAGTLLTGLDLPLSQDNGFNLTLSEKKLLEGECTMNVSSIFNRQRVFNY